MKTNWNWYGTWVVDWIYEDDPCECFEIWRTAYLKEHPELQDLTFLDLVMDHYDSSIFPIEKSLPMTISKILHFPVNWIQRIWWKIRLAHYKHID